LALPDGPQRQRYGAVAKLLAACLFDSDEYTKAVMCLAHVVRLLENDTHSRLLLTCWLCFLGHWSLARMQLNRRMKEKKPVTAHSAVIDGAIDCAIKLHTSNTEDSCTGDASPEQQQAIEKACYYNSVLSRENVKTFQQYQAQVLIK
uniref:CCR4-NOT transcription complex subunit 10 n=1 Tax=Gongylonema pulchrum TaxID=637853 RepID=A0A183EUC7_9BILA